MVINIFNIEHSLNKLKARTQIYMFEHVVTKLIELFRIKIAKMFLESICKHFYLSIVSMNYFSDFHNVKDICSSVFSLTKNLVLTYFSN